MKLNRLFLALAVAISAHAATLVPYQPANPNLTEISELEPTEFGLGLLEKSDPAAARATLGAAKAHRIDASEPPYSATGDGTTDDTAAIQAALDAGAGGEVFLPAGTYKVSAPLEIPSNTTLSGAGYQATTIFLAAGSNCAVITNSDHGDDETTFGNENITVRDLTIDGNRANQTEVDLHSQSNIHLSNVRNARVANVRSINGFVHCFNLSNRDNYDPTAGPGCEDVIFENIEAEGFGDDGITTHNSRRIVIQNWRAHGGLNVFNNNSNGLEIDEGTTHIDVLNGSAWDVKSAVEAKGHDARIHEFATNSTTPARHINIVNVTAYGTEDYAFDLGHRGTEEWGYDVTMSGCISIDCFAHLRVRKYRDVKVFGGWSRRTASGSASAVTLTYAEADTQPTGGAVDVLLTGISFYGYRGMTYAAVLAGQGSRRVTIESCFFDNPNRAIWIGSNSVGVTARGNWIECGSNTTTAILVSNEVGTVRNARILNNEIYTADTPGTLTYGVRLNGLDIAGVEISGNTITAANRNTTAGDAGISVTNATGAVVDVDIHDNLVECPSSRAGVYIIGNASGSALTGIRVRGNRLYNHQRYGVVTAGASGVEITGNRVVGNGTQADNTYAQIGIDGGSGSSVRGNYILIGANANKSSHPVIITSGTTGTWIEGNDFRGSATSESVSDSGTGSIIERNLTTP